MKKFKELKEKAKGSVKGLQESFGETKGEQYSDEEKQKQLADLQKLTVEAESVLSDWENKSDEAKEVIRKIKEYRDNKSVIWEIYNNHTKGVENPDGQAVSLLSSLKSKTKKSGETWGLKEKMQSFTFSKDSKEKVGSQEISKDEVEEVNKQLVMEEVEEPTAIKEEEKKLETASETFLDSFKETKKSFRESVQVKKKSIGDSLVHGVGESREWVTAKVGETFEVSDIWGGFKKKLKQHELGKEENIELKYRINEIRTKPEARLWLAHLLHPIHGKRIRAEVLTSEELEKEFKELKTKVEELKRENNNSPESQEKQQNLEQSTDKELSAIRVYDGTNQRVEIAEIIEPDSIKDRKILHGIIVTKKEESGGQRKRFFKLEERYTREKELYEDTYHILWRSLIKGGVDKFKINESRMERILVDRIASDLTSLNFLGFKKESIRFFASGLAKTSQTMNVSKWLTNNSFVLLIDLLNRWDSHLLGNADTPPAFNIRTAFSYSLIYETKIVKKWEEEFEKVCYELEDRSAELNIVELPKYTYEQKKEIAQKIVKRLFKEHRKENKERGHDYLSKFTNKVSKVLAKESEEKKFLEIIDRDLEDLITETWEERGTRKLRSELNGKFSPESLSGTFERIIDKEQERLQEEKTYFQEQVKRLENKLKKLDEESEKERGENKLKEVKTELKDRKGKIEQLIAVKEQQLVAQIESKNK